MIEIEKSYALDDSCQMKLWARGHYPWGAFIDAVEVHLKREDRNDIPRWVYIQAPVKSIYQRSVPCRDSIVSDSMYVYTDKPGRGASPVTVLDFWFPLHRYFQQDVEKVAGTLINEGAKADQPASGEDAKRLDWLDAVNAPFRMGWQIGLAPAGNVAIHSVIQLGDGAKTTPIRAAIDAAMQQGGQP